MAGYVWGDLETQFFFNLSPDVVLDAVDQLGFKTTGRCLTLNSMENRVYEIEVQGDSSEEQFFIVAKFYRPGRWNENQILEEHQFLKDLVENEVPVVAPLSFDGKTLFELKEHKLWYTVFPKKGGRLPQELSTESLEIMGRMLARLHNVGSIREASHRVHISPESFGRQNLKFLVEGKFIPQYLAAPYSNVVAEICNLSEPLFKNIQVQRIHGDCHLGNIIWRDEEGPFFIDFDDMLMGPSVQDIWLIAPGFDEQGVHDRTTLLTAYESMRDFNYQELRLIEPLRALRFIHFSAWIAKRWEDPAFKQAFVHFGSDNYWEIQLRDLEGQLYKIQSEIARKSEYEY